mgnify:CR=1 FL=1|jgi:HSP20 family molecular chaperone IbpA
MTNNLMSIYDNFFNNKNSFVGFNDFFKDLNMFDLMLDERGIKDSFPAYNVYTKAINVAAENEDPILIDHTFIEVACAGYGKDNLELNYDEDFHILTIEGNKVANDSKEQNYNYKGIATRSFKRMWKLNEKLKFVKAKYEDGILTIEFEPEIKATSEIKSLPIE